MSYIASKVCDLIEGWVTLDEQTVQVKLLYQHLT